MVRTRFLWIITIALSLVMAGVGYRIGRGPGKAIFVLGVVSVGGLLTLAATACSMSDSGKSNWQIAEEAAACLNPNYSQGNVEALRRIYSSREQIVRYRDAICESLDDSPGTESASESGGWGFFGFGSSDCEGCSNVEAMKKEYEANPLRAESQYRGRTVVVGGKIKSISGGIGAPLLARLENGAVLDFDKKESSGWLMQQNVGDTVEAQCRVGVYGWEGIPSLSECREVSR